MTVAAEHRPPQPAGAADRAQRRGRPLRFVALVLILWTGGRLWALRDEEPNASTPTRASDAPVLTAAAEGTWAQVHAERPPTAGGTSGTRFLPGAAPERRASSLPRRSPGSALARFILTRHAPSVDDRPGHMATPPSPTPPRAAGRAPAPFTPTPGAAADLRQPAGPPPFVAPQAERRWALSLWSLVRGGPGPEALGRGGQLGGSQAGARLDLRLGHPAPGLTLTAYGRLSRALRAPAAPEAALGLAVRAAPARPLPLSLGVERRLALGRSARNAFALVATAGLAPVRLGPGLEAEGYAQTGVVGLSRRDPFADGRLGLTRPLDPRGRIGAGLALSGGAQPGAARLDIGPAAHIRLPVARGGLRLTLEWRERIAGDARPGSGPALSLGGDF